MNTHIKSAINKITVEDELVEKTEKYLRTALYKSNDVKPMQIKKRSMFQMKKILVASIAAVFVFGIVMSGGVLYQQKTPIAFISLDINPSIELGINSSDIVVTAEGENEDGQTILDGHEVINSNISDALDQLVSAASENNFINDDGSSVISITAVTDDENKAAELQEIGEQAVNDSMTNNEVSATVYSDSTGLSIRKEAKELGVSAGKLKLIKSIQALDPTVTVDDLKNSKVYEIMLKANEVINSFNAENAGVELSDVQKAAIDKLQTVAGKTESLVRKAAIEQAKAVFEEAKNQAENIKTEAQTKAEELRQQAQNLLMNTEGMTEEEIAAAKAQAEALLKQAEELIQNAEKQAAELKKAAVNQKNEAIDAANNKNDKNDNKPKGEENKPTEEESKNQGNSNKENSNNGNSNNGKPVDENTPESTTETDLPESTENQNTNQEDNSEKSKADTAKDNEKNEQQGKQKNSNKE